jgi:hypothetical protein
MNFKYILPLKKYAEIILRLNTRRSEGIRWQKFLANYKVRVINCGFVRGGKNGNWFRSYYRRTYSNKYTNIFWEDIPRILLAYLNKEGDCKTEMYKNVNSMMAR